MLNIYGDKNVAYYMEKSSKFEEKATTTKIGKDQLVQKYNKLKTAFPRAIEKLDREDAEWIAKRHSQMGELFQSRLASLEEQLPRRKPKNKFIQITPFNFIATNQGKKLTTLEQKFKEETKKDWKEVKSGMDALQKQSAANSTARDAAVEAISEKYNEAALRQEIETLLPSTQETEERVLQIAHKLSKISKEKGRVHHELLLEQAAQETAQKKEKGSSNKPTQFFDELFQFENSAQSKPPLQFDSEDDVIVIL